MGRTVPTYIEQVSQLTEKWSKFRRCTRGARTVLILTGCCGVVRYYGPPAAYQASDDPREALWCFLFC